MSPFPANPARPGLVLISFLWVGAVAFGSVALLRYEKAPGEETGVAANWPGQSNLPRSLELPTLLVFAHPKCPCTRATIGELAVLMANGAGKVSATVVFTKPAGVEDEWAETDLWRSAAAIPGVAVVHDDLGAEATRFGARTSGHAMLYASDGRLLFQGGITDGRGHAGANDGRLSVAAFLEGGKPRTLVTRAFGCALFSPAGAACQP